MNAVAVAAGAVARWKALCPAAPDAAAAYHECMESERRCVYCGVALEAYPCQGCGQFLTAAEMHATDTTHGVTRCEACV